MNPRVAVVGGGIAGLSCAFRLRESARVVLFEKEPRAGGHALTHVARTEGGEVPLDVGFTVYNRRNYPRFCALLDELGIAGEPTGMSFSVVDPRRGWEYNGGSVAGLFADPAGATRPDFWRMLFGVAKLNRAAKRDLASGQIAANETLAEYLSRRVFPGAHPARDSYLTPMGAAIWSCDADDFAQYPARFALEFLFNHGLLDLVGRPQWMFIPGGSQRYVKKILSALRQRDPDSVRLGSPITSVRRENNAMIVCGENNNGETFDAVVFAVHARDALRLFANAPDAERNALAKVRFADNAATLHSDSAVMPSRRRAWACWNYRVPNDGARAVMTYNLSMLQKIPSGPPMLLTLNDDGRLRAPALARFAFAHPVMSAGALQANRELDEASGRDRAHYCGAWRGRGFHEDGVVSGERAAAEVLKAK